MTPPNSPSGSWTETILHWFTGKNGDGAEPLAALAFGLDGAPYGTTAGGGTNFFGTVYRILP